MRVRFPPEPEDDGNIDNMSWFTRATTALSLVVAVLALPVVLDRCAAACDTHRSRAGRAVAACHHDSQAGAQVGQPPVPCGHDHEATVAAAPSADTKPAQRALLSATLGLGDRLMGDARFTAVSSFTSTHSPPLVGSRPLAPLRI